MKLFSADQIREWDAFTIREQGIPSIDLMERAALASVQCLSGLLPLPADVFVFAGMGNNGGDGLAIARMLRQRGYTVQVYILANKDNGSEDFEINLKRLSETDIPVTHIRNTDSFPPLPPSSQIIDALFGTGLSSPLSGLVADLVDHINESNGIVYSIDIPSGMFADRPTENHVVIKSAHTLSFQIL
ncbi:MAG TPA: NAD(P)H-hydrate epimerase, partial [Ferruginibacter sp.]|nr:NAD(P)H-hydrate epimerase [Ferruginibacter sp.]